MTADRAAVRAAAVEAVMSVLSDESYCIWCGKRTATVAEWDDTPEGGRPDLCWDEGMTHGSESERARILSVRAVDTSLAPLLAALDAAEAEVERITERALGEQQCCPDTCEGGACESCPGCCAGWCVNGHDFDETMWDQDMNDEDHDRWWSVAREHNAGIEAALARTESAEAERDAARAELADLRAALGRAGADHHEARMQEADQRHRADAAEAEVTTLRGRVEGVLNAVDPAKSATIMLNAVWAALAPTETGEGEAAAPMADTTDREPYYEILVDPETGSVAFSPVRAVAGTPEVGDEPDGEGTESGDGRG